MCLLGRHFHSGNWSMDQMATTSTPRSQNYIFIKLFPFEKEEINNLTILTHLRIGRNGISKTLCHHLSGDETGKRARRQIVFTSAAHIRCINLHTTKKAVVEMKTVDNGSQNNGEETTADMRLHCNETNRY